MTLVKVAPWTLVLLGTVILAGCGQSLRRAYRSPQLPIYYKTTGKGTTQAGPFTVDWWATEGEQPSSDLGLGLSVPIGVTIIVRGEDKPEEKLFLYKDYPARASDVAHDLTSSSSTVSFVDLGVPTMGTEEVRVGELPRTVQDLELTAKLVRVRRVWDKIHLKNARIIQVQGQPIMSRWAFDPPGLGSSDLGLPVTTEKVPHNEDRIKIDLRSLASKYKAIGWAVRFTESTLGPSSGGSFESWGQGAGKPENWTASVIPPVRYGEPESELGDVWLRYYVDLTLGEYPFTYTVKVAPVTPKRPGLAR